MQHTSPPFHRAAGRSTSDARSYFRIHLEPLERRILLTTTPTYVNDNWENLTNPGGNLSVGDLVTNSGDSTNTGGLIKIYGVTAFGQVANTLQSTLPGMGLISDAISATSSGGTLNILEGTFVESDIVIDRPLTVTGAGQSGSARTLIVPEVASSHADVTDFGVGSHSGIIIYSTSVTVQHLALDGNGNNSSLGGTLNYHQGITTLYAKQGAVVDVGGTDYDSLHNGTLAAAVPLGSSPGSGDHRSIPSLQIDHVSVSNTFYHGISLAAPTGYSYGTENGSPLNIDNAIVANVGNSGSQDASRVGIYVAGLDNNPFAAPLDGNVRFSQVTNAGVGIETTVFGSNRTYGSRAGSRNLTGLVLNTVTDAVTQGYHIEFLDGTAGIRNNVATFSPGNNAVGVYLNHSSLSPTTFTVSGAKIGMQVQNSPAGQTKLGPILYAGNTFIGPGTGVAGSIGVLVDNSAAESGSSTLTVNDGTTISGYETGLKAVQNVAPGDGQVTAVQLINPTISGNANGITAGNGTRIYGSNSGGGSLPALTTSGSATIAPGFPSNPYNYIVPGNSAPVLAPPTADVFNTGSINLSSASTFAPRITGQAGVTTLFDFNHAAIYPETSPNYPVNGQTTTPYGVLSNWFGNITQDGTGQFIVGGTATNGDGLNYVYGTNNIPTGTLNNLNQPLYQLVPTDISKRTTLNIVVKASPTNQSNWFGFGLIDIRGNASFFGFSIADINTSTYTTLSVNLLAPAVDFAGPDSHQDLTSIVGYLFGGDQGLFNTEQGVPFGLIVDAVTATGISNSQLNATGTVDLGGAQLNATANVGFVPTATQQFTLVDNDGADPITGTFAGKPEGAIVAIGGKNYILSYTGGTGNDVVLADAGSTVVGRHLFYNQSGTGVPRRYDGFNAAINSNDDFAIAPNKTAYLPGSGPATFANVSSYSKGINGIMIDLAGSHGVITANDFIFRVGNNNSPDSWVAAPAPNSISVRAGAGISGSDRVVLTWANGAITKKWLEVIIKSNANTGLPQKIGYPAGQGDVFFFGNAVANSGGGDSATQAVVNVTDELAARNNTVALVANTPITNLFDYNRDGQVNTTDALLARNNPTNSGNVVRFLNISNPPAAPSVAAAVQDSAIASALSLPSTAAGALSESGVPRWLVSRLQNLNLNSGPIARYFEHLAEQKTPAARKILARGEDVTDELGLDDSLLDSLLAKP